MKYNRSLGFLALFCSMACHAAPFTIIPQGTLPTSLVAGSSVSASYTITNNTLSTRPRARNFVKWLPQNVTQVLEPTDPTVCGATFDLGPRGSINQSCTLKLKITGAVYRDDVNPQNHLFICFPGGKVCAGPTPANSLNVALGTTSGLISTAVGLYITADLNVFPLTLTTTNNGATWTASAPSAKGLSTLAVLHGVGCSGQHCSAIGVYNDSLGDQLPFSYSSTNAGLTWSKPYLLSLQGIPHQANRSVYTGAISCVDRNCATVGTFRDNSNLFQPLSYSSSDYGVTWSKPYLPSTTGLPANQQRSLLAVSCSGALCSAGGFYNDALSNKQPMFYHSIDGGITWSKPIIPSHIGLPPGYVGAKIVGISCSGLNCTAIGSIEDQLQQDNIRPFSYLSSDGGLTWSKAHLLSQAGIPSGNQGIHISSLSCVENKCTAVGYWKNIVLNRYAIYYTSTDRGANWSKVLTFPTKDLPLKAGSFLSSVFCEKNICSAVGRYLIQGTKPYLLTYQSLNNGITWNIYLPNLPDNLGTKQGGISGVGGSQSGLLDLQI